jgi:uncharacterized repeat protein (TIGR01451 family)
MKIFSNHDRLSTSTPTNQKHPLIERLGEICGAILCLTVIVAISPQSSFAQVCGTPSKDGIGSLTGTINTYYPGTGTAAAGSTTVEIGTIQAGGGSAIAAGDLVLIIQMQDGSTTNFSNTSSYGGGMDSSVGSYEYAKVSSISGGTLTLSKALVNTYTQATQKTFQVIRVPQHLSASLSGNITALPWNGSSGGIVAFDVYNTLDFNSKSIDVTGKGFRGGGSRDVGYWYNGTPVPIDESIPFIFAGTYDGSYTGTNRVYVNKKLASLKGEGTSGTPRLMYNGATLQDTGVEGYPTGDVGRGAPGNAGGGGVTGGVLSSTANTIPGHDAGGGGGGNIGAGGVGGDTWQPQPGRWANGGLGGSRIAPSFTKILMGGGGGAGITTNAIKMANRPVADGVVNGGPGGGIVLVRAGFITGTGSITAKGVIGTKGDITDAGGGGGAGGSVLIAAKAGSFLGLTVNVSGGNGADSTHQQHGPGGGGGGGLVAYGGGATNIPTKILDGGAAGFDAPEATSGITASNYGSTAGAAGMIAAGLPHSGCTRPNVLIVKRVTAINNQPITGVVHNSPSDSDPNWPSATYLQGAIDAGKVNPNDEIEYTIYYLNSGNVAAKNLRVCDRLHKNLIFQTQFDPTNIATVNKGINLTPGTNIIQYLSNTNDADNGYLSTTSTLPTNCNLVGNAIDPSNLSDHVVVVNLADSVNYLSGSTSPGNPPSAHGYIRFKAKVKP